MTQEDPRDCARLYSRTPVSKAIARENVLEIFLNEVASSALRRDMSKAKKRGVRSGA